MGKTKESIRIEPIYRDMTGFQGPLWNDLVQFFEHYHGDTGRDLGASHQTGWSALVALKRAPKCEGWRWFECGNSCRCHYSYLLSN